MPDAREGSCRVRRDVGPAESDHPVAGGFEAGLFLGVSPAGGRRVVEAASVRFDDQAMLGEEEVDLVALDHGVRDRGGKRRVVADQVEEAILELGAGGGWAVVEEASERWRAAVRVEEESDLGVGGAALDLGFVERPSELSRVERARKVVQGPLGRGGGDPSVRGALVSAAGLGEG